jgi:ribosomal protein RSM22 (predicted rRNA methylase)
MFGANLVKPLEQDWRETLDDLARARGWPTSRDVAKLSARVADLSRAYNDSMHARAPMRDAGAARLVFAFVRDVPKGAGAVRELVATGSLPSDRPLRVLDVGAGLGAMTWGLVRAIEAAGRSSVEVEATWVDEDALALQLGRDIVNARARAGSHAFELRRVAGRLAAVAELGKFDVILAGHVLSELDVGTPADARVAQHVMVLRRLIDRNLEQDGALVVVEPALRDRTRHLHRIRGALVSLGFRVFAPCLHGAPCPALVRDSDWCHEDLAVDLPPWLIPVARLAGLRHQGLTFSYLVMRKGGSRGLVDALNPRPGAGRLRLVSEIMRSKGKSEAFLCGEFADGGALVAARGRVARLRRHHDHANWIQLKRGDVVTLDPAPELKRDESR